MADCFIVRCNGDPAKVVPPLVLLEGNNDGVSYADEFTGFSEYYTDTPAGALVISNTKGYDYDDLTRLGYVITKGFSIVSPDANYTDSAVISSNEKINLTNYNTICIYFYGYCNYSDITMNNVNDMAAYFMVDRPEVLPQSKNAYDWTGWDNMFMNYRKYGKYYFDISQITGEHYLSFGIYHGNYHAGYNNGIKIYKITLM